jgi:putative membrane protein
MMWWYGNGMGAWGYILMTVSMALFWGLIIYGVVALVRYLARADRGRSDGPTGVQSPSPEHVLANRFAAGEIDEQDYRHRMDILSEHTRPLSRN